MGPDSNATHPFSGDAYLHALAPRRVLVFRALQLGDMLCSVPALRALRRALPMARIVLVGLPWAAQFATRYSHLLDGFIAFPGHEALPEQARIPALEDAFAAQLAAEDADLAIQLHGSGAISNGIVSRMGARHVAGFTESLDYAPARRNGFLPWPQQGHEILRLLALMRHLGAPVAPGDEALEFPLLDADLEELHRSGWQDLAAEEPYACIHPGARFRNKCWPPACFAEIADRLAQEAGLRIVLTGSAKEAELTAEVAARMRHPAIDTASPSAAPLSIGAMAALMRGARLLVSNDTGVSHIAAAFRLPGVVIFNKADMQRWAPLDAGLHRCLRDVDGTRLEQVWEMTRGLLKSLRPDAAHGRAALPS